MRRSRLAVCVGTVLALASASTAWGQEEGPTAGGDGDAGAAMATTSSEDRSAARITEPCPSVIVRNTTLRQDCVGPISFGADGVQLNLAGHTVTCNGDPSAIGIAVVDRTGDRIVNGRVVDCGTGILLLRGGEHQITNVALDDHDQTAPAARPPTGTVNHGAGLEIQRSVDNDVVNVRAARNRIGVFTWIAADRNDFRSLEVTEGRPPFSAMEIQHASENTVIGARFEDPFFEGLLISGGTGNVVRSSSATGAIDGFAVGLRPTFDTLIQSSEAFGNRRSGIRLGRGTSRTTVMSDRATDNARSGIAVEDGSTDNVLTSNTALGNGVFDLADGNAACDNNDWRHNRFETANQPCIE